MLTLMPILALLAAGDSLPRPAPLPSAQEEAAYAIHQQPDLPLVALRLSLIANDPAGLAGAGHLMQHLMYPAVREQVERVGGRVRMQRTADALVYTVTGPARELPLLAGVLRSTLSPPAPTQAALVAAGRALAEERLAEWETAERHVRAALRLRLFPNDISAAGTEQSAARLSSVALDAWRRMYHPSRVSVLAVGDVTLEQVRAAFGDLPAPAAAPRALGESVDTVSMAPLARAEATQGWMGAGYLAADLDPAAVSVTARLLRDLLRERIPEGTAEADHWWSHLGQALVLVVGAPPTRLTAARRSLDTVLAALDSELTQHRVREAAHAIRRDMLFYSRTPDRMAEVLGHFADREGEPDAAQEFYAALERVGVEQVRPVLQHLLRHSPARIEIEPQKLNRP